MRPNFSLTKRSKFQHRETMIVILTVTTELLFAPRSPQTMLQMREKFDNASCRIYTEELLTAMRIAFELTFFRNGLGFKNQLIIHY